MKDNLFDDVVAFILNKPGYMKWGKAKLAEKLDVSENDVDKAKNYIRDNYEFDSLEREYYPKEEYLYKREDSPDPKASEMDNTNENENRVREEDFEYEDMSLEEYCEWVDIDYDLIDPYKDVKYWTDAKGRRRYSVVPRVDTRGITKERFVDDIRQALKDVEKPVFDYHDYNEIATDVMGIINPTDAHIDKLCLLSPNRTIRDNINIYKDAVLTQAKQLQTAGCQQVYLVLGSDLWNTNDANSTTKRGTPQKLNTHYRRSYRAAITANVELVREINEMELGVDLIVIEGNHDEDKVFHMGVALQLLFEDTDVQIIYDDTKPRQYIKWGVNLLGFGHGYHEKKFVKELPLHMAEEAKEYWGQTDHRIFFLGDIHQKKEYSFLRTQEHKGVEVRFLRDISMGHSQWDLHKGWHTYPRSTEAFVFHKERGQIASFTFNL